MANRISAQSVVREFVRGERSKSDLRMAGLRIAHYDDAWEIENPNNVVVDVHTVDLARGFLRFQHDPPELQNWSKLVLAASSFLDFTSLAVDPEGDTLVAGLWDAAFDGHCADSVFAIASAVSDA